MAAPAGTPKPIIDRLNAEVRKAVEVPEVKARLSGMGGAPAAGVASRNARPRGARAGDLDQDGGRRRHPEAVMSIRGARSCQAE